MSSIVSPSVLKYKEGNSQEDHFSWGSPEWRRRTHEREHFSPTASFPPLLVDLNTSEASCNLVFVSLRAEGEVNDAVGGLLSFLWGLTRALQPRQDDSSSAQGPEHDTAIRL